MGVISYIKIGAAVVVLGVASYFVYEYKHMQTVITGLEDKVAGLELRAEVIEKAQAATDKFTKTKTKVVTKNVQQRAQVDQVVESKDNAAMQRLFLDRGMLQRPQASPAASGKPGGP